MAEDYVMSDEAKARVAETRARVKLMEADKKKAEKKKLKKQKIARNNRVPV